MDGNGYFFGPESFQRESPPGQSANFRPSAWLCCFPLPCVSSCLMLLSYGADGAAWALGHRADAPKKMTLTVAWSIHVGSFIVHSLFALFHNVSYVSVPGCCQVAPWRIVKAKPMQVAPLSGSTGPNGSPRDKTKRPY